MNTLIDRLRTLIIDGNLKPNDVLLLSLVAGRLENLELTNNVERDAKLGERIESLELELKVANDCRIEAVRGAEVERAAAGLILKYEESERAVRDTRKGEWPEPMQEILRWRDDEWYHHHFAGSHKDCWKEDHLWLPAPPPPTDD